MLEEPSQQSQRAPIDWPLLRKMIFSKVKLPGWLLVILALFNVIPDFKSRFDFWSDMVRSAGGHMSQIAAFTSSTYFPVTLGIAGLLYLVFVGEAGHTQRHPALPYLGWSVLAVCFTAIASVCISGAFEVAVRRAVAERQSTVLHDGTNPKSVPEPPDPSFDYTRTLSRAQFRTIVTHGAKLKPFDTNLFVSRQPSHVETYSVWQSLTLAFNRAGIHAPFVEVTPENPSETGIMIVVRDTSNISEGVKTLRDILEVAGIEPKIIAYKNFPFEPKGDQFILFIGPRPI